MLNVDKLIESAKECLGWPYKSPGSNDRNGIDCSGLFVKCYRDQHAQIYHGSNTIYRDYCGQNKGIIVRVSQLIPGMAVFKWNPNTPEKFSDGLGDFQHIGMVVSINPLRIIHASSVAGCVTTDTSIGKWKYYGQLKDVNYGIPEDGGEIMKAIVTASNGQPVNMREKPSKISNSIMKVPVGAEVEVNMEGSEWTLITYRNKTGYMMTEFLDMGKEDSEDEYVTVKRSELQEIYDRIDFILHG